MSYTTLVTTIENGMLNCRIKHDGCRVCKRSNSLVALRSATASIRSGSAKARPFEASTHMSSSRKPVAAGC